VEVPQFLLRDMVHMEHGADVQIHVDEEHKREHAHVTEVLVVVPVLAQHLRQEHVVVLLLPHDGVDMVHGADVLLHVDEEHKQEEELASEVHVVDHVLEKLLRRDLVELQLLHPDMVHMEHGADAHHHVAEEHKQEYDHVTEVLVVDLVVDLLLRLEPVVAKQLPQDGVDIVHGVDVLLHVAKEHKQEEELASEVLVVDRVLEKLLRRDLVELQLLHQDMEHLEHGVHVPTHVDEEHKQEDELVTEVLVAELVVAQQLKLEPVVAKQPPRDTVHLEHGVDVLFHADLEHKQEHEHVTEVLVVDHVLDQLLKVVLVVALLLLQDTVLLGPGVLVPHNVVRELKQERELVSQVHVEERVLVQPLRRGLVEPLLCPKLQLADAVVVVAAVVKFRSSST